MSKEKKKQHFIPRFIIKNFRSDRIPERTGIWLYDKEKRKYYQVHPKDICFENNINELHDANGKIREETRNVIENVLEKYETKWAPIVRKAINRELLSEKEKAYLYLLVAAQCLRTPEVLEFNKNVVKENIPETPEYKAETVAKLSSLYLNNINPDVNWIIDNMLKAFGDKHLSIIHSNKKHFILNCKRPVLFLTNGYSRRKIDLILLPIGKNTCIMLTENYVGEYIDVSDEIVTFINRHNFENDTRFIIADFKYKPQ